MRWSFTQTPFNPAGDQDLKEWVDMFVDMSRQTSPLSNATGNEEQAKSETTHTKNADKSVVAALSVFSTWEDCLPLQSPYQRLVRCQQLLKLLCNLSLEKTNQVFGWSSSLGMDNKTAHFSVCQWNLWHNAKNKVLFEGVAIEQSDGMYSGRILVLNAWHD